MVIVEKAFAYVTNGGRLLVFTHADFPDAGIQVPAGTICHGESSRSAVLREVHEETGLSMFTTVTFLGMADFDARPHGKDEMHRRHFFHLPYTGRVPDNWRHYECHASDVAPQPIAFDFYWVPLVDAAASLSFGHGALTGTLQNRI
ncbi:MAG TPA: NUDIX domain-containing protein [Polyangiaceae bacterium]